MGRMHGVAGLSKTRFGVSDGGYCSSSVPVFTQKRGVVHFDWTFFTVMQLVACQVTMERKYHWLLYLRAYESLMQTLTPKIAEKQQGSLA
jgi:hypothetical protein